MLKKIISKVLRFLPIQRNKVLFFGYYGAQYGCSPKYISKYMMENAPVFNQVWAVTEENKLLDSPFTIVKFASLRFMYEWATARFIITNYRLPVDLKKKKKQIYIQTWHSSLRLKMIENDAVEHLPSNYVKQAQQDSLQIDYLLSGCSESTEIFKRSFWYDGPILEFGTPRIDKILAPSDNVVKRIKEKLDINNEEKILLYAPTFRKGNNYDAYITDFTTVLTALNEKFGGEWKVMIRLHPHLINEESNIYKGNHFISATKYPDIQELLIISDFLITDYSSLMFDFLFSKKPVMLYVPDLDSYIAKERELYYNIEELPFIIVKSKDDICSNIMKFDSDLYVDSLSEYIVQIGSFEDGRASERIVNFLKEKL